MAEDRKTNCDVCGRTFYCFRTGRIYHTQGGHWHIKDGLVCQIDEDVEREYALFDGGKSGVGHPWTIRKTLR